VRGYPPAPGAPDPVYPPGQFSPWNSAELRTAAGHPSTGRGPGAGEPGYPQLAVSDPAADATSTQTWAVLDEAQLAGEWTSPASHGRADPGETGSGARAAFGPASGPVTGPSRYAAQPGPEQPAGFTDPGQPGGAAPGQAGARPGGRLGARRSRAAARDAAQSPQPPRTARGGHGTAQDFRSPDYPSQDFGTPDYPSQDFGTPDYPSQDFGRPDYPSQDFGTAGGFDATGDFGTGGFSTRSDRAASPPGAPTGTGPRGSRSAARGRTPRKPASRVRIWLMPVATLILVGALITVVYLNFVKGQAGPTNAASPTQHPTAEPSSAAPPGPWKHITTRQDDPMALTLAELFPARFTASGVTAVQTVTQAGTNCARMVIGGKLQAALRKGGCTQVMRASYLDTGQKIMATIGVLNLASVTDSEQAGKATGATAFIKQLPGAKGPTRNLMNGTGLEEAEIKGHYLILTWAEFTNLKAPKGAKQRAELDTFSRDLVGSTANVSLTSRMLLGKPTTP
jgi:hypothetical protein